MTDRTRATLILAPFSIAYIFVILRLDIGTSLGQQLLLGVTAWVCLGVALRYSPPAERVQVVTMILVATCCECVGSLLWGAYRYRLENIPLYVPPGHGIFFLVAVRLSELPWLDRHRRLAIGTVFLGSCVLMVRGMLLLPAPDLLGLVTWLMLLGFLSRGSRPVLYAVSYALTMALEFWGTANGNWAWAPMLPFIGLSAANPPFGVGGAYCAMDGTARRIAPHLERALRSTLPRLTRRITLPRPGAPDRELAD